MRCPFDYGILDGLMLLLCEMLVQVIRFVFDLLYEVRHENTAFCKWGNKGADQLCGNHAADQCLCFRFIDRTILLLRKSEMSNL